MLQLKTSHVANGADSRQTPACHAHMCTNQPPTNRPQLEVAYFGPSFCGLMAQAGLPTVSGVVDAALAALFPPGTDWWVWGPGLLAEGRAGGQATVLGLANAGLTALFPALNGGFGCAYKGWGSGQDVITCLVWWTQISQPSSLVTLNGGCGRLG